MGAIPKKRRQTTKTQVKTDKIKWSSLGSVKSVQRSPEKQPIIRVRPCETLNHV